MVVSLARVWGHLPIPTWGWGSSVWFSWCGWILLPLGLTPMFCKPSLVLCVPPEPVYFPHSLSMSEIYCNRLPAVFSIAGNIPACNKHNWKLQRQEKTWWRSTCCWNVKAFPPPQHNPSRFWHWMNDKWGVTLWTLGVILWLFKCGSPCISGKGSRTIVAAWGVP